MSFRTLAQVLPAQAAPEFIASGFKESASIAGGESEAQESASPSVGQCGPLDASSGRRKGTAPRIHSFRGIFMA